MCNCNKRTVYISDNSNHSFLRNRARQTKVKLIAEEPLVVNGDYTGRMYVFRWINDIILVDKRDAENMRQIKELQVLS